MVINDNNITHKQRERLFLLDGSALAYRAYYSFISRPLITSKGENTGAVFGFVNSLMKILNEEKPDHIAVVFDRPEPTFRHKMYEPYKATRQKMPEDMASQLARLREVVEAFNVPILEMAGYEADDIMGTLAHKAEAEGMETFLVTSDKDFMQLISPLTKIYKPGKSGDEWEIIDFEHVEEKFGVTPDKVVEVLGLTGDKSDNVPGVPGIGEMTAIPLVREYGTIENILNNIHKISKPALQQKLRDNKEIALLSKTLVTIDTNVPIDVDIHHLKAQQKDIAKLTELFTELEFKYLIRKLTSVKSEILQTLPTEDKIAKATTNITTDQHQYHIIKTDKELDDLARKLKASKFFVFDTETTSTNPLIAELVGLSFSLKPKEAYYIPIKSDKVEKNDFILDEIVSQKSLFDDHSVSNPKSHPDKVGTNPKSRLIGFEYKHVLNLLSPIFKDESIYKCGQNIKYDLIVLKQNGLETAGTCFDTMIANYILRPDGRHNLDSMALEHLNYKTITFEELVGKESNLRFVPVEKVGEYSAEDADITFRLYEILGKKLRDDNLLKISNDIEFPLIEVLTDMEFAGVKLDTPFLKLLSKELEGILYNTIEDIYHLAGKKFNINSTQQLGIILFEDLKLPTGRKTKTGFSTDVGVLESLKHQHPIVDKLLEYRTISKIKSTYVDALPALINPKTGRVHTSFNQTITTTGRLSSSNPNLQNIPIRSELGREIRKAFIPEDVKWAILSADYSQIELRIMAHISNDPGLTEAFNAGEDIHASTAAKIFGYELNDFKSLPKETKQEMRRKAKEVNFGIMYGLGYFGLANRLDIPKEEARTIIAKYHERFPNVKLYMEETINKAKRDGYVETLLGRRRYFPDIKSRNQNIRSNAERQAINMPIQGTAADMIKLAMIRIHRRISNKQIRMLLQVHDELVFEVQNSFMEDAKILIVEEMKNALPLNVPLEIEVGSGKNWFEAH
ncbi:MAG: DNA polymerase I [Bacteroidota bacterium]|nr:DNA polymerase I [Bacteroidota bacterium]